jgi:hypothetical protein
MTLPGGGMADREGALGQLLQLRLSLWIALAIAPSQACACSLHFHPGARRARY